MRLVIWGFLEDSLIQHLSKMHIARIFLITDIRMMGLRFSGGLCSIAKLAIYFNLSDIVFQLPALRTIVKDGSQC